MKNLISYKEILKVKCERKKLKKREEKIKKKYIFWNLLQALLHASV